MNKLTPTLLLTKITSFPAQPIQMLKTLLERTQQKSFPMNLATVDKEFGVLNRTVMFRGIVDDSCICFVTERNSRKYLNLKKNSKIALTILMSLEDKKNADGKVLPETWQIRLLNAEAVELDGERLQQLWMEEPVFAKIRSHICECGKPQDELEYAKRCKEVSECSERENCDLEQTKTYTAFKIIPKIWDFYKSEPEKIADRIQYKLNGQNKWEVCHVDA